MGHESVVVVVDDDDVVVVVVVVCLCTGPDECINWDVQR